MIRRVALAMACLGFGLGMLGAEEPRPIPPEQFDVILRMIKRQRGEWAWADLPWVIDFAVAQRKALSEGKPIFVALAAQGSPVGCL